jgi:hypothetical protein
MQTINKLAAEGAIELDYESANVPVIKIKSMDKINDPDVLQKMYDELLAHQEDYKKGLVKNPVEQPAKPGFFKRLLNKIAGK